jgi:alkanesulfonate monooxygenase SsuD/methylene tetrahydromethanopterin reductase-like flavin-dependent oxidoreductase (luciferase family)
MEYGLFYQLPLWPDQDSVRRYEETLEQIELGEALGFDVAWLAELHFISRYSVMPAPSLLAAAAAQRTKRIRLGIGVNLLPLHDPIRAAENGAVLDILSGGRLEYGVGRGAIPQQFDGFGVDMDERNDRFDEALGIVLNAWKPGPFSHSGQYYQYEDLDVVPKPVQRPHPPLRLAVNSIASTEYAARRGMPIMLSLITATREMVRDRYAVYRQIRGAGAGSATDLAVMLPVHVAASGAVAREEAEETLTGYLRTMSEMVDDAHRKHGSDPKTMQERAHEYRRVTYETILTSMAAVGDVDEVCESIRALQDDLGVGQVICWFNAGGRLPDAMVRRSMRMFMEQVRPRLA